MVIGLITSCSYIHALMLLTSASLQEFKVILSKMQSTKDKAFRLKQLKKAYNLQHNTKRLSQMINLSKKYFSHDL